MSSKVCKDCGESFSGFTPICKACNAKKAEMKGPIPPVVSSQESAAPAPTSSAPSSFAAAAAAPRSAPPPPPKPSAAGPVLGGNQQPSSGFPMSSRGGRGGPRGGMAPQGGQQGFQQGGQQGQGRGGYGGFNDREASLFGKGARGRGGPRGGPNMGGNPQGGRGGMAPSGPFGGGMARKVHPCKHYPNCKYSDEECNFIHPTQESGAFKHMQKMCQQFKDTGSCKYGTRCNYLHDSSSMPKRDVTKDSHKVTDAVPQFGTTKQKE